MAPNMQESSVLLLCPSFNSYNSIRFAEIAHKVSQEFSDEIEDFGLDSSDLSSSEQVEELALEVISIPTSNHQFQQAEEEEEEVTETAKINKNSNEDDEFEFAFCRDHESLIISSTADEIFSNGQIRPVFPIFNQNLLPEDLKPQNDTLKHFPAARTYCILTQKQQQSPDQRCKKSNSTGTSKLWKPRDNLITRSNSDGKEDIVYLASSTNCCSNKKKKDEKKTDVLMMKRRSGGDRNVDQKLKTTMNKGSVVKSAHEIHYVQNRALKEVDRRRTFLPYRKDLIGFFANVNGLTKQLHPF